jgi:uncharacterized membrane-anchored protein
VSDFNAELHARPSIYFSGPAFVEHVAVMHTAQGAQTASPSSAAGTHDAQTLIERHTEFTTITRVTAYEESAGHWPDLQITLSDLPAASEALPPQLICRVGILVLGAPPSELGSILSKFAFGDTAASTIGGGDALVCSDFRVRPDQSSRILLFNNNLNAYRLGRMVRRICEIETYRAMSLLGLAPARTLSSHLNDYDSRLVELTNRNRTTPGSGHKGLLDEISDLSAQIISAAASTRNRFGATAAYAKIVEERIGELRETHVPGFQRFGVFVARRFKPAVRTCEATALRLDQLSHATMHLIDLLQTRIQVEIELQNAVQIQAMADRAETQVRIQRAVEGFSVIAISYYLVGLLKALIESVGHAGYEISPMLMLVSIPIVLIAVAASIFRVKHALAGHA